MLEEILNGITWQAIVLAVCSVGILIHLVVRRKRAAAHNAPPGSLDALIQQLKKDRRQHEKVEPPLSPQQVDAFVQRSGFRAPPSFRAFLTTFAGGAEWLYRSQAVDSTARPARLRDIHPRLPDTLALDSGGEAPTDSLFCLMAEDSNGGAWCWLTATPDAAGEYPLAYFDGESLHYRVDSFTAWLRVLVSCRNEVIRELDREQEKLNLG